MEYETVYRYSLTKIDPGAAIPFLFAILGPVFIFVGIRLVRKKTAHRNVFAGIFLCCWGLLACGFGGLCSGYILYHHFQASGAIKHQVLEVVEGEVHVLREQPAAGHDSGDLIEVGGRQFEFSYYQVRTGYTRTIAHGGVLREGAQVRLHVSDGNILRIDIMKKSANTPDEN